MVVVLLAERRVYTAGEKKLIMDPLSPLKESGKLDEHLPSVFIYSQS